MSTHCSIRRALISVYDKTGIVEFARALHGELGVEFISTGGTAKTLREAGIPVTLIEDITGFPEMLDGRVKTLHPKIHAAILADRDNPEHMRQLAQAGIQPIDMVVVNLYPFEKTVADPNCTFEQAIEMIDIGGVALLRAAAKNHKHVHVLTSSFEQKRMLSYLRNRSVGWDEEAQTRSRGERAWETLWLVSQYDAAISSWIANHPSIAPYTMCLRALYLEEAGVAVPRYGENPHQKPEVCELAGAGFQLGSPPSASDNPALSYNNYLDADAALGLCAELARAAASGGAQSLWRRFSTGDSVSPGFQPGRPRTDNLRPIRAETHARRNLPHIQNPGATYFVTFRLKNGQLAPAERDTVLSACKHWHGQRMTLHAACVMPDHVHMLLTPHELPSGEWVSLSSLLHSIKRHSATEIQKARGSTGPRWQQEAFDRIMRDEKEFLEKWDYIEHNPATAGLVSTPRDYRWLWRSDAGFGERVLAPESDRLETGRNTITGSKPVPQDPSPGSKLVPQDVGTGFQPVPATTVAACVFIKHTNACGVGLASNPLDAYRRAYLGDPNAAMGGILACNFDVDADFATAVMETYDRLGKPLKEAGAANAPGGFFLEVWLAPSFTDDAVAIIRGTYEVDPKADTPSEFGSSPSSLRRSVAPSLPRKKWGANVRLLAVGDMTAEPDPTERQYRSIAGGMLVQTADTLGLNEDQWKVATGRKPTDQEMDDLRLAWLICKHTKSNAITICRDGMLLGNGAGQMSRVMSCRVATWLARENGHLGEGNRERGSGNREETQSSRPGQSGSSAPSPTSFSAPIPDPRSPIPSSSTPVAASDAFFPFRDGVDLLIDAGVTAIIQPGGSKRDDEVIAACNQRGVAMVFTGTRHFRH